MLNIAKIKYWRILIYLTLGFFTYLLARITFPYFNFDQKEGFLAIKQNVISNKIWLVAFYIHVFTSCFLLLAGFTQFSSTFLYKYRKFHRRIGKMYVIIILFLSGPCGLIMAIYANGGLYSRIGFLLLSVLWLIFTSLGWYFAIKGNYLAHRKFMIRSFALTISAITLRLWKLILVMSFEPNPMDVYRIVAWLGWIPNLILAEWIISKIINTRKKV